MLEEQFRRITYFKRKAATMFTVATHFDDFRGVSDNSIFSIIKHVEDSFYDLPSITAFTIAHKMDKQKYDKRDYCDCARAAKAGCLAAKDEIKDEARYKYIQFAAVLEQTIDALERYKPGVRLYVNRGFVFPTEEPEFRKEQKKATAIILRKMIDAGIFPRPDP